MLVSSLASTIVLPAWLALFDPRDPEGARQGGLRITLAFVTVAARNARAVRVCAALLGLASLALLPSLRTNGRHRLNRGGNRQANAALHRLVIVRMRWHEPIRAYVARRTAAGFRRRTSSAA